VALAVNLKDIETFGIVVAAARLDARAEQLSQRQCFGAGSRVGAAGQPGNLFERLFLKLGQHDLVAMRERAALRGNRAGALGIADAHGVDGDAALPRRRYAAAPLLVAGRIIAVGDEQNFLKTAIALVVRGLGRLAQADADARARAAAVGPQFLR